MSNKFLIFLLLVFLTPSACKKGRFTPPLPPLNKDTFALVFVSNIEGYVVPCGCTSNPLGGIDRFAQVFLDIKNATAGRIALIAPGDLLFDTSSRHRADLCQDNARLDLLLSTLSDLGLKKTLPGPYDEARGLEYRQKYYQKFDLSSLNSESSTIINAGDFDIALLVITLATTPEELQTSVKRLKDQKRIKAIIAISQLKRDESEKMLGSQKDIDIVIQSQTTSIIPTTPKRLGSTGPLLIEGGRQGQFATILFLQNLTVRTGLILELDNRNGEYGEQIELATARLSALKAQKEKAAKERQDFLSQRIKQAQTKLSDLQQQMKKTNKPMSSPHVIFLALALTKKVEPLKSIKNKLDSYEKSIPDLVAQCESTIQCPTAAPETPSYVGVQTCKNCHTQAYEVWQKAVFTGISLDEEGKSFTRRIGHSKAWATLSDIDKDHDRSCIACHSIGFMKAGGYCRASDVDFRKDVQCESCHGPGSLHAQSGDKKFINRRVNEETCRHCHHVPHIQSYESFNYDRDLIKILGPGHGANLLKELKHKAVSKN